MKFNAYLFRSEVTRFEQLFVADRIANYADVRFRKKPNFNARAWVLVNRNSVPPWVPFYRAHCHLPKEIENVSNSFILAIEVEKRFFALTHGQGYLALDRDRIDPHFGIDVAVKSVLPSRIRSTESRDLKEVATLKQLVLSRESGLDQFEVDFDREILYRLEGTLGESDPLGSRVRGAKSCGIYSPVAFEQLGDWCSTLLRVLARDVPRNMKRTQSLSVVTNAELQAKLGLKLQQELLREDAQAIHLSPADIRSYNQIVRHELIVGPETIPVGELDIAEVRSHLKALPDETLAKHDVTLRGVDEEDNEVDKQLLETAVVCETVVDNKRYVHFPYYWVEVDDELVRRVDEALKRFAAPPGYSLPAWKQKDDEGQYNKLVGNEPGFLCLDRQLVTVAGRARAIEPCDLLSDTGDFIHVKEYKGSQSITHLVSQAQGASDLLLEDRDYREELKKVIQGAPGSGKQWTGIFSVDRIYPSRHRVVLAIGAPKSRPIPESLPYLSKQALVGDPSLAPAPGIRLLHQQDREAGEAEEQENEIGRAQEFLMTRGERFLES